AGNVGTSTTVDVIVSNVADTVPPSVPGNLTAAGARRKISLTWSASTDNVGVTGDQIWRAATATGTFTQLGTTSATTFTDSVAPKSTWFYYVKAFDQANNVSAPSNTATATAR